MHRDARAFDQTCGPRLAVRPGIGIAMRDLDDWETGDNQPDGILKIRSGLSVFSHGDENQVKTTSSAANIAAVVSAISHEGATCGSPRQENGG